LCENVLFHMKYMSYISFGALGIEIWHRCSCHCCQKDYKCVMNCMHLSIDL
jgi:hypothetical protein